MSKLQYTLEKLKEMQLGNKMVSLLDRPIILGHDADKHDKIIHYILGVTGSVKYPGKSFELTLSKSQSSKSNPATTTSTSKTRRVAQK